MELEYIIVFTVGIILGAIISTIGSIVKLKGALHEADNYLDKIKELESKVHFYEDHVNYYRLAYKKQYNSNRIELKELKNKNNKILQEISDTLGIDEVILPSFGKVYLNQNKFRRDIYNSILNEDLD